MPRFLSSRQFILLQRPLVVGTVAQPDRLDQQARAAQFAAVDIVEIRLDAFPEFQASTPAAVAAVPSRLSQIRRLFKKPLLLTYRAGPERGPTVMSGPTDRHRGAVLQAALPWASLIDVEIRNSKFAGEMTRQGHRAGVDVIHSCHDFRGNSSPSDWNRWAKTSSRLGGDIFKIAVTPRTNDEVEAFLLWGASLPNPRVTLIAMGAVGEISRCLGYSFGSVLTYGHLSRSAAPGQWPAKALARTVRTLYEAKT